jgi:hypothetical protein
VFRQHGGRGDASGPAGGRPIPDSPGAARAAIGRDQFLDDAEPDDYGSGAPGMVDRDMVNTPSGFVLRDN